MNIKYIFCSLLQIYDGYLIIDEKVSFEFYLVPIYNKCVFDLQAS